MKDAITHPNLPSQSYTYDAEGRVLTWTDGSGGGARVTAYAYDDETGVRVQKIDKNENEVARDQPRIYNPSITMTSPQKLSRNRRLQPVSSFYRTTDLSRNCTLTPFFRQTLRNLQRNVEQACKTNLRSCEGLTCCCDVKKRMNRNLECITARTQVMLQCYPNNPDPGHIQAVQEAARALAKCRAVAAALGCK